MINWNDVLYAEERRKDDLVWAEKERLIRQMRGCRSSARVRYRLWLAHLGAQLVTWGRRLQARYATPSGVWPSRLECRGIDCRSSC